MNPESLNRLQSKNKLLHNLVKTEDPRTVDKNPRKNGKNHLISGLDSASAAKVLCSIDDQVQMRPCDKNAPSSCRERENDVKGKTGRPRSMDETRDTGSYVHEVG